MCEEETETEAFKGQASEMCGSYRRGNGKGNWIALDWIGLEPRGSDLAKFGRNGNTLLWKPVE